MLRFDMSHCYKILYEIKLIHHFKNLNQSFKDKTQRKDKKQKPFI